MRKCPNCEAEIEDGVSICASCGYQLPGEAENEAEREDSAMSAEAEEAADAGEAAPEESEAADAGEQSPEESERFGEAAGQDEKPGKRRGVGRWTWLSTVIVIAGVIAVCVCMFFAFREPIASWWEDSSAKVLWDKIRPHATSKVTIGDYSVIEVAKSETEVDDDSVDTYIDALLDDEELTDEWVRDYAASHEDADVSTTEEFREYIRDYLSVQYLHNAIMSYLKSISKIKSYDETQEAELIAYSAENLEYYAYAYGLDADTFASYYGFDSALDYETSEAHDYMNVIIIVDRIAEDLGLTYADEDVDESLQGYLDNYGYSDTYTLDEFKTAVGDVWVFLYQELTFKYDLVTTALEDRVVYIDDLTGE